MQKVLVIVGPTASGKSALAVKLAKQFDGEVISADSRQVYRGLNVGTGKITKREMDGIPHHLLDVADPKRVFSANDFVHLGRGAIADIAARGKLPIICGGTGFYIDALLGHIELADVSPNPVLRKKFANESTEKLFAQLKKIDPFRAEAIDAQNRVRLIRAIEIATATGSVLKKPIKRIYDELWIGIEWPKEKLHGRIRDRLLARMKVGLVAETQRLYAAGLSYKRMRGLGLEYRYLADYLQDKLTKEELVEQLAVAIRQYAKRQLTYWRRNKEIDWLPATQLSTANRKIAKWLHS